MLLPLFGTLVFAEQLAQLLLAGLLLSGQRLELLLGALQLLLAALLAFQFQLQ